MKNLKAYKARNPDRDIEYKVISEMRATTQCVLDGCTSPLTHFQGPGSLQLCREHQLRLREYGGPGRLDRPYTFWKKDYCESCGRHPSKDNPRIAEMKEPMRTVVGRMMLQVDHKKVGGQNKYSKQATGVNHPKNLLTLCAECHQLKTYKNSDHIG